MSDVEIYESENGYFYVQKYGENLRISQSVYDELRRKGYKQRQKKEVPRVGDEVEIAIKPYKGATEIGTVIKVLTKKKQHTRGHKVMLKSGTVGRILRIVKRK